MTRDDLDKALLSPQDGMVIGGWRSNGVTSTGGCFLVGVCMWLVPCRKGHAEAGARSWSMSQAPSS